MTYIIANSYASGRSWAKGYLSSEEPRKILHTGNQIRGHAFTHSDCLYLITNENTIIKTLMPALCGCSVFVQNDWILKTKPR